MCVFFLVADIKIQRGVTETERASVILRAPKKRLLEKEVSTWRGLFVFPMMEGGILQTNKSQICRIWILRI